MLQPATTSQTLWAFGLVVRCYWLRKYISHWNPAKAAYQIWKIARQYIGILLCAETRSTKVLLRDGRVVTTVSIRGDTWWEAVPDVFINQVQELREKNLYLAYVGLFGSRAATNHQLARAAYMAMQQVEIWLREYAFDGAICVVNDSHVNLYLRKGFVRLARVDIMPGMDRGGDPSANLMFGSKYTVCL